MRSLTDDGRRNLRLRSTVLRGLLLAFATWFAGLALVVATLVLWVWRAQRTRDTNWDEVIYVVTVIGLFVIAGSVPSIVWGFVGSLALHLAVTRTSVSLRLCPLVGAVVDGACALAVSTVFLWQSWGPNPVWLIDNLVQGMFRLTIRSAWGAVLGTLQGWLLLRQARKRPAQSMAGAT
jgi:hypothetical protein